MTTADIVESGWFSAIRSASRVSTARRNEAMLRAFQFGRHSVADIADAARLSRSQTRRILTRGLL